MRGRMSQFQQAWGWKQNQPSNWEPLFLGFVPRELKKPLPCVRAEHGNVTKGHSSSWDSLSLSGKAGMILSKRTRCTVRNPFNTCPQQLETESSVISTSCALPKPAPTSVHSNKLQNVGTSLLSMPPFLFLFPLPLSGISSAMPCSTGVPPACSWQSILPGKIWRGVSRGKGI